MQTVCAIILDYFGSGKTIACLSSLLGQKLDAVMIVDNSGDKQANVRLQNALNEFRQRKVPFVIYQIVNQQNLGYAKGVNDALRWLEENNPFSYYLLINNDAEATGGMLEELLIFMRDHNRVVLTSPMVVDTCQKKVEYRWYHRLTGLIFSHHIFGTFPYLSGCCLLVDRRIIKNGLFDEDYFMYGEDVELCWRLQRLKHETVCVDRALVKHEVAGSSLQGGFFYEYHMVLGHILLARKLAKHKWEIPFLYGGRLLVLTARAIVRSIRFRSLMPLKAYSFALCKSTISNKKVTYQTGLKSHV